MKQPPLGKKVNEIRKLKGITQNELSESCNIDIRTIQRIESGEVIPRMSTLKLIASALSCDLTDFNGDNPQRKDNYSSNFLFLIFIIGIIYFINWLLYSPIIPTNNSLQSFILFTATIYTLTGVLFYYGFYVIGKYQKNKTLQITSIIIMVCIPLFLLSIFIPSNAQYGFVVYFNKLVVLVLGINCVFFGIGLLKAKSQFTTFYKIAGILQILIGPFFILPVPILNIIGFWLSIPFLILLLIIVFFEYRNAKNNNLMAVPI